MKSKKKFVILAAAAVVVVGLAAGAWLLFGGAADGGSLVYVMPVAELSGNTAASGVSNRFIGKVEPQDTKEIQLDSSKTLKDIFVEEGQHVNVGDELFSYDVDAMELQLAQLQLDIQSTKNSISDNYAFIEEIQGQINRGEIDSYTGSLQIQQVRTTIKSSEYSLKAKDVEVNQLKRSMDEAVVTSDMAGIVTSINADGSYDMYGNQSAFMTIMAAGEYLVKGRINELNIYSIYEGMPVILRSRVDENVTWKGSVKSIATAPSEDENNNYYYYGSDSSMQSSDYDFFVELSDATGLMLGQHLIIEPDLGQGGAKDGLFLSEWYIADVYGDAPYVWLDKNGKLTKQPVVLGEYNADTFEYEIAEGITADDYIAFPEEGLSEGSKTTTEYVEPTLDDTMEVIG